MSKKLKSDECSGRWCNTHLFSMTPYFPRKQLTKQVVIRLCPKFCKNKRIFERVMPLINIDRKPYTPLFILEEDKNLYTNYDERNRQTFQLNQELQLYEISEIMVPKVNHDRSYCKVCQQPYSDYLEHISLPSHRDNLRKNSYSGYILELQDCFKNTQNQVQQNSDIELQRNASKQDIEMDIQCQIHDKQTFLPDKVTLNASNQILNKKHQEENQEVQEC